MGAKHGYTKGITDMGNRYGLKCNIFEMVNLTIHGYQYFVYIHMFVQFQKILA